MRRADYDQRLSARCGNAERAESAAQRTVPKTPLGPKNGFGAQKRGPKAYVYRSTAPFKLLRL
ncbi:MAG: hypothetical protein DCC68_11105 [Planctomycetota bacterium]|nr:MAG: hypothetical protein DCC68_11105 [Planctomycetota bacterium]